MKALENYLNNATRGIWGKRKLEIREELTADILERTRRFELIGLSRETATVRAIQELGDARVVNRGMTGVYMMPTFVKTAFGAAMISVALVLSVQPSIAQVTGTTRVPIQQCLESKVATFELTENNKTLQADCEFGQMYISLSSLKKVLQPLNVKFTDIPSPQYHMIAIDFPEGFSTVLWLDNFQIGFPDPKIVMNPDYLNAQILLHAFSQTLLEVRMTGWENPRISVGQTTFTLGGVDNPVKAASLYTGVLYSELDWFFPPNKTAEPLLTWSSANQELYSLQKPKEYMHKIRYNAESGTIVIVLSREPDHGYYEPNNGSQKTEFVRRAYLTPILPDGTLEYPSRSRSLHFANQINKLKPITVEGTSDVIALHFTGNLSVGSKAQFEIIKPGALSLESSKKR